MLFGSLKCYKSNMADCVFSTLHRQVQFPGVKNLLTSTILDGLSLLIVSAWKWQDPILNGCAILDNRHIVLNFFASALVGACAPTQGEKTHPHHQYNARGHVKATGHRTQIPTCRSKTAERDKRGIKQLITVLSVDRDGRRAPLGPEKYFTSNNS